MGRFFDETEKRYMDQFTDQHVIAFHHVDKIEAYHQLLEEAISRNSPVTVEEIKAYFGEEAYERELKYLKSWED